MSRSRRRISANDSLELLLDTICNTFGGIVFIALLVSLLISQSSTEVSIASVEESKQAEMQRLSAEIEASMQTLDQLRKSDELLGRISKNIDDPQSRMLMIRKDNLQNAIGRLQTQVSETLVEVSQEQAKVNDRANNISQTKKMLDAAKTELVQLESELKESVKDNSRVFGFPIAHATRKSQFTIALKSNKFCFFEKMAGGILVVDPEQVNESGNFISGITITPKFENGIPFNTTNMSAIDQKIKQIDSESYYATVFIWDDSIEAFQMLSDLLISNQIKYEIITMTKDSSIVRGGRQGMVQ